MSDVLKRIESSKLTVETCLEQTKELAAALSRAVGGETPKIDCLWRIIFLAEAAATGMSLMKMKGSDATHKVYDIGYRARGMKDED